MKPGYKKALVIKNIQKNTITKAILTGRYN
jgi:hypothetical protein